MREVNTSESAKLNIHASAMTCLLYEREFGGKDMVTEISEMGEQVNFGVFRRALWAMAKTANPAAIPPYSAWMSGTADIDYRTTDWMTGVMYEYREAFFRGAAEASEEEGQPAG